MSDISELFDGFESFEFDTKEALEFIFPKFLVAEATLQGLREYVLKQLSEITGKPIDAVYSEFQEFCEPYQANSIADFLSKFGKAGDNPR